MKNKLFWLYVFMATVDAFMAILCSLNPILEDESSKFLLGSTCFAVAAAINNKTNKE